MPRWLNPLPGLGLGTVGNVGEQPLCASARGR